MLNADYIHQDLRDALEAAWCAETAYPSCRADYPDKDPSWGNCFVSSLVIWAVQGGEVCLGVVDTPNDEGLWHARNVLEGHGHGVGDIDVDATWQQFDQPAVFHPGYNGLQSEIIVESVFNDETLLPRLSLLIGRMKEKAGYIVPKSAEEIVSDLRQAYRIYDPSARATGASFSGGQRRLGLS